jgi:hypothetical protein
MISQDVSQIVAVLQKRIIYLTLHLRLCKTATIRLTFFWYCYKLSYFYLNSATILISSFLLILQFDLGSFTATTTICNYIGSKSCKEL